MFLSALLWLPVSLVLWCLWLVERVGTFVVTLIANMICVAGPFPAFGCLGLTYCLCCTHGLGQAYEEVGPLSPIPNPYAEFGRDEEGFHPNAPFDHMDRDSFIRRYNRAPWAAY